VPTPNAHPERILRDALEADLPIFFEHQRDPEATRMAAFPARNWDAFTAHWKRILASDAVTKKTILCDGEVAGNILSFDQEGKRLVGYWIGREFWGRGLATRALSEFLDEVTVRPLYAYVATTNVASIRVLEKCGFVISDARTHFDERLGRGIDEVLMELRSG
jgi:RimJ/RimL family protein N-acetyltransferase